MATLDINFKLDVNDIIKEAVSNVENTTVEEAIIQAVREHSLAYVSNATRKLIEDECEKRVKAMMVETINGEISRRIDVLLNEESSWPHPANGTYDKAVFVGTLEDYTKLVIDTRMKQNVDSYGKPLNGCSGSNSTLVEYLAKTKVKSVVDEYTKHITKLCTEELEKAKKSLMMEAAQKALVAAGFTGKVSTVYTKE